MLYDLELKVFPELRSLTSDRQSNVVFDVSSCHLFEVDDVVLAVLMGFTEGKNDVQIREALTPKFGEDEVNNALTEVARLVEQRVIMERWKLGKCRTFI